MDICSHPASHHTQYMDVCVCVSDGLCEALWVVKMTGKALHKCKPFIINGHITNTEATNMHLQTQLRRCRLSPQIRWIWRAVTFVFPSSSTSNARTLTWPWLFFQSFLCCLSHPALSFTFPAHIKCQIWHKCFYPVLVCWSRRPPPPSLFSLRSYKSSSGVNNRRTELFLKEHDHLRK